MDKVRIIAFDADDTLWVNEPVFTDTKDKFCQLLSKHISQKTIEERLFETELNNLRIFGYGIKGFMLSMIETAIELTKGEIEGDEVQQVIDLGKNMLQHPVEILDGVPEVLDALEGKYELMILTKGDLFDQEGKIARSGLANHFQHIEIVSEKSVSSYQSVLKRHGVSTDEFVMIGNSVKSDILPVLDLGAEAIHIPFHTTWEHEIVPQSELTNKNYHELSHIKEVLDFF